MEEVTFGQYSLPVLLTVLMGVIFKFIPIADRWKALLTIFVGTGLGILALAYAGKPWEVKFIVDYLLFGFMAGASAVGLYEGVYRTTANPRE